MVVGADEVLVHNRCRDLATPGDWSNRLSSVDIDSVITEYEYPGNDTRLSQTTSAGTRDYLVERQSGLPYVVNHGISAYLHDGTGNSTAIDDTSADATCPITEGLGSVSLSLDDTSSPIGSTNWDDRCNGRTSSGRGYQFGYTGQQYADTADLYFSRARYNSPGTAQFTVQPSAGGATGYNAYQYANSNPTTLVRASDTIVIELKEFYQWHPTQHGP